MVEVKRGAVDEADAPSAKRASRGSGALEEDLEAQVDVEQEPAEDDVDAMMFDDGIELQLGEAGRNWERPEPKPHDCRKDKMGMFASATLLRLVYANSASAHCQQSLTLQSFSK